MTTGHDGLSAAGRRPARPGVPSDGDERTTLAWDRTALTLLVVAAGTARHTWSALGPAALLPLVPLALLSIRVDQ